MREGGEACFAEEVAEGRVAQGNGLVGAELQHGDCVCRGEVDACGLGLEARDGGVDCESLEGVSDCVCDDLTGVGGELVGNGVSNASFVGDI